MSTKIVERHEVPVNDTWDLESIFKSDTEWEQSATTFKEQVSEIDGFRNKLSESAETLYLALSKQLELQEKLGQIFTYAHMRHDQDTGNSYYSALQDKAYGLVSLFEQRASYITPELLAMDPATLDRFVTEHKDLQLFSHLFDQLRKQREHILSEREEELLARAKEALNTSSQAYGALNNADLAFPSIKNEKGEEVQITHGRFVSLLQSEDRDVRKAAFEAVYATYEQYKNTFAATLSGQVKSDIFNAQSRNYASAREAALSETHIPVGVYDQLISTVEDHLPLLHRYVKLRKKCLGVDELHMYDLYTPIIKDVEFQVSYEEAKQKVIEAVKPLGEEYVERLTQGFEDRWVDIHENKGKRSGAYSSGAYGTKPFILMNWQDDVDNLFTLAHEFGHSMHSDYTRRTQPYLYGDYTIFVAEVASTLNESLLHHHMIQTLEEKEKKLYILNYFLEGFRGTVFRQTMFAEFEQMIHEKVEGGGALTAEELTQMYYELNVKYYGPDMVVDKEIGFEWARIPHFYYNFYVFQYATGYSAAAALSKQILEEGQPAVDRFIDFLKTGSSDYPIQMLKKAGVDMTTSEPVEQAMKLFETTLDQIEQLIND
ncbi:oligoendopeptidase F [Alkalicoccobacillus murimartini]|uniref:Oligopeptidase F n=1 Tax=Alkalicoccobacillus murimartini TaxID=171685 RepID=A0ABT9YJ58_9BACI|nr:oligoendopeptidase F [Alkalicoccobacillus murimartini]MDQ0207889.1 oligoendopeptidase F [Alkalicoccobacillus murimartini]